MEKIIKFGIELLIFSILVFAILMIIGLIIKVLEIVSLPILIAGIFLIMIISTVLEFGDDIDE